MGKQKRENEEAFGRNLVRDSGKAAVGEEQKEADTFAFGLLFVPFCVMAFILLFSQLINMKQYSVKWLLSERISCHLN